MTTPGLPAVVLDFLCEHIDSHEQLEILLLLRLESPAWWSPKGIASQLSIPEELAAHALTVLLAHRLVATQGAPSHWSYAAASPQIADAVDQLASCYSMHRFEIVHVMSVNAIKRMRTQTLQAFADAFVLRKDKGDG
jgi:hypothetical protein